ncbi:hypothetical protein [Paraburkholderia phytofirmans]|uniref:hypothetical protein n=1 Tax=Paraburkholderia phytofirmans TaxID=261302 RepID=UPI0038B7FE3B
MMWPTCYSKTETKPEAVTETTKAQAVEVAACPPEHRWVNADVGDRSVRPINSQTRDAKVAMPDHGSAAASARRPALRGRVFVDSEEGIEADGRELTMRFGRREFMCATLSAIAIPFELKASTGSDACLFSRVTVELPPSGCNGDSLGLRHLHSIDTMVKAYSIGNVSIDFIGCTTVAFKTQPDGTGPTQACTIYYPSGYEQSTYLAPIAHELAHVFQLQDAGGLDSLQRKYSSLKIELEADFLAGVIFKNFLTDANAESFHTNLNLIGKFRELKWKEHGSPAQRAAAYQRGLNLNFSDYEMNMRAVHAKFQNDVFGEILDFSS